MKFSLLVFVLTSVVLNAYCGQLSDDPAPGRSPGPPETWATTIRLNNDITTITANTPHIHVANTKQPPSSNVDTTADDVQSRSRFSESPPTPPSSPNESIVNSRHREHIRKSHGNSAATHHKLIEKLGKTASKTGNISLFAAHSKSFNRIGNCVFETNVWGKTVSCHFTFVFDIRFRCSRL